MSDPSAERADGHPGELFVVHVRDEQNDVLAGHDGGEYRSPPQERELALELVARLLGRPVEVEGTVVAGNVSVDTAQVDR